MSKVQFEKLACEEAVSVSETYEEMGDAIANFLDTYPTYREAIELYESASEISDFSERMAEIMEAFILVHIFDESGELEPSLIEVARGSALAFVGELAGMETEEQVPQEAFGKEYYFKMAKHLAKQVANQFECLENVTTQLVDTSNSTVETLKVRPDQYEAITRRLVTHIVRPATKQLKVGQLVKIATVHEEENHHFFATVTSLTKHTYTDLALASLPEAIRAIMSSFVVSCGEAVEAEHGVYDIEVNPIVS